MRKSVVETAALAALLLCAALASCQQAVTPPPKTEKVPEVKDQPAKSKLEEMLQKALQDNPDLRLAAVKLAQAEAELNRARLQVVRKVGAAYQAVEAQKAAVRTAAAELERMKQLSGQNAVDSRLVDAAEDKLLDAKAKLAALETEIPYLIGKQPANNTALPTGAGGRAGFPGAGALGGGFGALGGGLGQLGGGLGALGGGLGQLGGGLGALGGGGPVDPTDGDGIKPMPVLGKTAERIRTALDKPFTYECKEKLVGEILQDMSKAFQESNPGLLLKDGTNISIAEGAPKLSVHFDRMPFGTALEWMEDSLLLSDAGPIRVVVRDYGLIIASEGLLPPGAPSLHDFWNAGKAEERTPAKDPSLNPPAENVEGRVKTVDAAGLVLISIGSDAGIAKGHTLEVYRLDVKAPEQSKYLGRIKIIEATPTGAVGQPIGKMAGPVQVGDHVSTPILGN